MIVVTLPGGLLLLLVGGELLVRGAVGLAEAFGVPSLLIGLTVVALGTSAPELVTGVEAALYGAPDIAIGKVVGSTLINCLVILGIAALIAPLPSDQAMITREGAWLVGSAALLTAIAWMGELDRVSGCLLILLLAVYVARSCLRTHAVQDAGQQVATQPAASIARPGRRRLSGPAWLFVIGLGLLIIGGDLLVTAAIGLAQALGASESVIGLTIVSVGTTAPELIASAIAAGRRHTDLAIGNVLGSTIYNMLGVTGIVGLIAPTRIDPRVATTDLPVTVAVTVLVVLAMASGRQVSRIEGGLLVCSYAMFLWLRLG